MTRNYDNMRSGVDSQETILTPGAVTPAKFGKLFSYTLDSLVYTQPLYVPGLTIGGAQHNVVFVATENDTVYAFDADQKAGGPLWQKSLVNTGAGETSIPCAAVPGCSIAPALGVTATPVISLSHNAIYIESRSVQNGTFMHKLHALDLTTGAEVLGGPTVISASVPGSASDADAQGKVNFNPLREHSRPALLLSNGVIYLSFASVNDQEPYHGWVLGYSADTLQPVSVFNVTPNGSEGGIWANNGASADANGSIYVVAGNGTASPTNNNFGNSYLKLSPQLALADYFMPFNASALNAFDVDVGSGGLLLLPDQTDTPHTHLIVAAGKEGRIYLIDRDNMGKFNAAGDTQIVQSIPNAVGTGQERNFYPPVFWNGRVYFSGANDVIRAFSLQGGQLSTAPVSQSSATFTFPGTGMIISSNGSTGGILWALEWNVNTHVGTLHAYDPTNLTTEFWSSDQSGGRDALGAGMRLTVPLVANGKVYVGGSGTLTVYGLLQ
ncbi:MAG TPA: hypothetical protein VKB56_07285 [Terriglobales bacterium]|nr:hypothetical protein [Terriglobales bacterium]